MITDALAIVAQSTGTLRQRPIIGDERARIARGTEVLGGIKAVGADATERTGNLAAESREMCLRTVFHQRNPMPSAELLPRGHGTDLSVKMHEHDSLGLRGETALDTVERQQGGLSLDIGENGRCPGADDREDGGECGLRSRDHLVAPPDVQRAQRDLDRIRPVRRANRMRDPAHPGPLPLEGLDLATEDVPARVEHARDSGQHRVPQRRRLGLEVVDQNHLIPNTAWRAGGRSPRSSSGRQTVTPWATTPTPVESERSRRNSLRYRSLSDPVGTGPSRILRHSPD